MAEQWFVTVPLGRLAGRLARAALLAFNDISPRSSARSPFGPSGRISQGGLEVVYVLCFLVSAALGGAVSLSLIHFRPAAKPPDSVFPAIIAAFAGGLLGMWLDAGVANGLQSGLGRLLWRSRLPQLVQRRRYR